MGTQTALTAEDLLTLPDLDPAVGKHYELSDGELIIVGSAKPLHELVKARLARMLYSYLDRNPIGEVFVESQFSLAVNTARIPDVAFVRKEKLVGTRDASTFAFGPDLAIEIISPSETFLSVEKKIEDYLSAGVAEIWQVLPDLGKIVVRTESRTRTLHGDDILETPVLPGFRASVRTMFDFEA
jgi:Uma2 family endonuclease